MRAPDGGFRLWLYPPYETGIQPWPCRGPGCASLTRATRCFVVAVGLDLDLRDLEAAEHRRPWRPERRPCPGEASLGAVPPWTRRTGDRCGEAG
ncbi:hypothetical protein FKV25_12990, partial [Lysobacter aestuarii]